MWFWAVALFGEGVVDVVIPCIAKDIPILEASIASIKAHVKGVRRVITVSPEPLTKEAEWVSEGIFPFSLEDMGKELGVGAHERRGWYLQQLLKLYAPFIIPDISENVLIVDADTIFLTDYDPLPEEGMVQINIYPLKTIYATYLQHMKRLYPTLRARPILGSPVVHHMLFQKDKLKHLFSLVEGLHKKPFWKAFLHEVKRPRGKIRNSDAGFYIGASEYTIYFYFLLWYYPQKIRLHKVALFNEMKSLDQVEDLKNKGFEMASCHHQQREQT